jgi:hypothetical protein
MPPQQFNRLLDFVHQGDDLGAHDSSPSKERRL